MKAPKASNPRLRTQITLLRVVPLRNWCLSFTAGILITLSGGFEAYSAEVSYTDQVAAKPVFLSPIEWLGTRAPSENESQVLLQAISSFEGVGGPKTGMTALEGFLGTYPDSAWAPSLRVNMAEYYRTSGRYTLALAHWEKAWLATKDSKQAAAQVLAVRAIAGWTSLLGSLGQKEKIRSLFKELDDLHLALGTHGTTIEGTKDGLAVMTSMPSVSYRCGSFALGQVAKVLGIKADSLFEAQSPDGGFHLSQLLDMASSNNIPVKAVRRPPGGDIVVPSVIHWKLNHYAAILEKKADYYRVMDPTFGGAAWIDADTIDEEASGAFLVPKDRVPTGWQELSAAECASIYGKGFPNDMPDWEDPNPDPCDPSDDDDSSCDLPNSNDGAGGDGGPPDPPDPPCNCGMPTWNVSEPYASLWLQDTPLLYRLSNGKWMKLQLRYKQRGEYRGANFPSFGDKWECSWLGAMFKSSSITDTYTNHMVGGGITSFNTNGFLEYWTARRFFFDTGLNPILITPMGAQNAYRTSFTVLSGLTAYPLTHKVDRFGRTVLFNYTTAGNAMRLSTVTDIDGQNCTLTYTNAGSVSNLIASVSDPYGRAAKFYYDSSGRLTNITDMAGMATGFQYDSSDNITNMVTPYGPTSFQLLSGTSTLYSGLRRAVLVTEPSGDHQLVAYCDLGPNGVSTDVNPNYRNSYRWNRAQYANISPSSLANVLDMPATEYTKGSTAHWLHGPNDSLGNFTVTGTVQARAGTTDPFGNRPATSFTYQGQSSSSDNTIGTLRRGATATTVLGDTYNIQRNSSGRPTNTVYINSSPITVTAYSGYTNVYDAGGTRLLTQTGPHGEFVRRYTYNPTITNLLATVTNVLGEGINYTYDTTLVKVTGMGFSSGLVRSNIYYSSGVNKGFLLSTMDVGFRTNGLSYLNGNLASQTNELGLITTFIYDNLNRLISTGFPDGTTISNLYDKLDLVGFKDRLNQWTYYGYNTLRQRIAETNANGQVTQYYYCGCGSPSQITRWLNGTAINTLFNYDSDGRLTNVVYPDGYQLNRVYNDQGLLSTISDSTGQQLFPTYAQIGTQQKISTVYLDSSLTTILFQQRFDEYGRVTNSIDRNGVVTTNSYDLLDRLVQRRSIGRGPYDNTISGLEIFSYDSRGLTNYTDPLGHLTSFVRDPEQRLLYETNANSEVLQFGYNASDEMTSLIDGKLQPTTWKYDQYGRVTNKVDALGTNAFIYLYDSNNRLTSRTNGLGKGTVYKYDALGNLTNVVYPVSSAIYLQYDGINRLTNVTCGSMVNNFSWTLGDQLASESGSWTDDKISYTYNNRLRASLSLLQPNRSPWTQTYGYDEFNRMTNVTSVAGAFTYQYVTSINTGASTEPDLIGKLIYPSGAYSQRFYNFLGELTNSILYAPGAATILDGDQYFYDEGFQRTQQVFQVGNYINYTYDNIGQLKTAFGFESGGTARLHEKFGYAYDKAWNLSYATNNALIETFTANAANELSTITRNSSLTVAGFAEAANTPSVTVVGTGLSSGSAAVYGDGSWARAGANPDNGVNWYNATATDSLGRSSQDAVTNTFATSVSYAYDASGNLLNDGQRFFSYDDENQLTSVTISNAWRSEFTYDGLLRRRKRVEYGWSGANWLKTNEVRYVYDGRVVIQERDGNNISQISYTRGKDLGGDFESAGGIGGLLGRTDSGLLTIGSPSGHSFYHSDATGNITCLVNTNSAIVAQYSYDPFGNLLIKNGSLADVNLYRFSSKEMHANSGLTYYLYRYYDGNLHRWLNRDPLGDLGFVVYANGVLNLLSEEQDAPSEAPGSDAFVASQTRIQMNLHKAMGNSPVNYYDSAGLAEVYCQRQNGQEERLHNASVDDLAKKLDQAAKEKNPITDLRIKDHGSPELMQMSKESLLTTSATGRILDDKGNDLTDKFKNGLAPNAMVCLNGCETGRGKDNIAKNMSQILPGKVVVGGAGVYQLNLPFTSSAIGKKNYYINGKVCNSQW